MKALEISLEGVTLQQINVFLSVAQCGGFAKAGEDLHMTQPAVSKSIAKLEKGLGITLFWRNTRNVTLTEAGRLLCEEWSRQIEEINDSYLRAHSLQKSENITLRVGLLNTARPERYFWDIEDCFRKLYPDIQLILASEYMTELEKKLAEKKYDIILIPDFEHFALENEGMKWKWVAQANAQAYMSKDHPLAKKESLTTEDLLQEEFVTMDHGLNGSHHLDLVERFSPWNVKPNVVLSYRNAYDVKYLFRNGSKSILLVDAYFDYPDTTGVIQIPITDQKNGIICGWNPNNRKPPLQKFLAVIDAVQKQKKGEAQ